MRTGACLHIAVPVIVHLLEHALVALHVRLLHGREASAGPLRTSSQRSGNMHSRKRLVHSFMHLVTLILCLNKGLEAGLDAWHAY